MAKISACFQLCPLIDQKSFMGVTDDCDNGHIIVSLGRNIIIRYRLSDQKQVSSWSVKERLLSPVIYDECMNKYVGVFNTNAIKMWNESDVDLSKVRKYKFNHSIHCVLSSTGINSGEAGIKEAQPPIIVFKDGRVLPLTPKTLMNRKNVQAMFEDTKPLVNHLHNEEKASSFIEDVQMIVLDKTVTVCVIVKDTNTGILTCNLVQSLQHSLFATVAFQLNSAAKHSGNEKHKLTGYTFIGGDKLKILTLWSDGGLYCLELYPPNVPEISDFFPGEEVMKLTLVNTQLNCAILPLDAMGYHVAIYGSDPSEEGALLAIVNIRYKLEQCKYSFKLYCTSPKLWSGGSTDLLLIVGQHLAVAHYRLIKQKLAALVGMQQQNDSYTDTVKIPTWQQSGIKNISDFNTAVTVHDGCQRIANMVADHFATGLPEAQVFDDLISSLVETQSIKELIWLFESYDDIPMHCLLVGVDYCLTQLDDTSEEEPSGLIKKTNINSLLRVLLQKNVMVDSKALATVRLRLSHSSSLILIGHLIDMMVEYPGNIQLINWATILLDSYYHLYVISKDSDMIRTVTHLRDSVNNQLALLATWQELLPLMDTIKIGPTKAEKHDNLYSLDSLRI